MADLTTISAQGHFGAAIYRLIAIATQGHFIDQQAAPLQIETSITQRAKAQEVVIRQGDTNVGNRKRNVTIQS